MIPNRLLGKEDDQGFINPYENSTLIRSCHSFENNHVVCLSFSGKKFRQEKSKMKSNYIGSNVATGVHLISFEELSEL